MNKVEEKIIMYDSPEAAQEITLTGWLSGGDKRFWYKDEHMARWSGCTHLKCECGNVMSKSYTKCESCRHKANKERYDKLPYKEWDGKEPVVTWDGDTYFFDEESLIEYMEDNELKDLPLLICTPIYYQTIDGETVASDSHEDWEPEKELQDAIKAFNEVLRNLPAHSYTPGKVRTSYSLHP